MKLIAEKVENRLELIGTSKDCLDRTPTAQVPRTIVNNKWDHVRLRSLCKAKTL